MDARQWAIVCRNVGRIAFASKIHSARFSIDVGNSICSVVGVAPMVGVVSFKRVELSQEERHHEQCH